MGLDNPLHIAFLVVILLLVFGAKRLPEIGRSLGGGMREFKQSINGEAAHHQQQPPQQTLTSGSQQPAQQPAQQAPPQTQVPVPSTQAATPDPFAQRTEPPAK